MLPLESCLEFPLAHLRRLLHCDIFEDATSRGAASSPLTCGLGSSCASASDSMQHLGSGREDLDLLTSEVEGHEPWRGH